MWITSFASQSAAKSVDESARITSSATIFDDMRSRQNRWDRFKKKASLAIVKSAPALPAAMSEVAGSPNEVNMGSLTIRNLDDATVKRRGIRAVRHWRSLEEEVRAILNEASKADVTSQN